MEDGDNLRQILRLWNVTVIHVGLAFYILNMPTCFRNIPTPAQAYNTQKCEFMFHNEIVHMVIHTFCHYIPFACIKPDGTVGVTIHFIMEASFISIHTVWYVSNIIFIWQSIHNVLCFSTQSFTFMFVNQIIKVWIIKSFWMWQNFTRTLFLFTETKIKYMVNIGI